MVLSDRRVIGLGLLALGESSVTSSALSTSRDYPYTVGNVTLEEVDTCLELCRDTLTLAAGNNQSVRPWASCFEGVNSLRRSLLGDQEPNGLLKRRVWSGVLGTGVTSV